MGKGGGGREGLIYKEEMGKVFHYTSCNFKSSKSSIGGRRGNFMLEKIEWKCQSLRDILFILFYCY